MTTRASGSTRAVDHWQLLEAARARLLHDGGPPELWLLGAQTLAALGLKEPAELWLSRAPANDKRAAALAEHVTAMAPSEVSATERLWRVRSHLASNEPLREQIGDGLESWEQTQRASGYFTAMDGRAVTIGRDPLEIDVASDADGSIALPPNTSDAGFAPRPVLLAGVPSGRFLERIHEHFDRLDTGARARLIVIEPSPNKLLDALAELEDPTGAVAARLECYTGPGCLGRAVEALRESGQWWKSLALVPADESLAAEVSDRCRALDTERASETGRLVRENSDRYRGRDRAWWADRFRGALRGDGQPLRIMVITTRYSTYIQHAASDICDAARAAGHEATLLIEPENTSSLTALAFARQIHEIEPDLIVSINFPRTEYAPAIPHEVPYVCWVQDAMPHLFKPGAGRDVDALSMVVGSIYTEMIWELEYPMQRCYRFGVPALAAKFRAEPRAEPTADLFIATNHGQTPDQMAERLEQQHADSGGEPGLISELWDDLHANIDSWQHGFLKWWLDERIEHVVRARGHEPRTETIASIERDVARPLINRLLRHRLVTWAAELAEERGWNLRIAGRGWQGLDRFAPYAVGELTHGAQLRDAYQDSLVTLHSSTGWLFHQRLHECVLAGGLPAVMLKPEDDDCIMAPTRLAMREYLEPTCTRLADRRPCVPAIDDDVFALTLSTLHRVTAMRGWPESDRLCDADRMRLDGLVPWCLPTGRQPPRIPEFESARDRARYLLALTDTAFWSKEQLADVVERCRERPDWRTAQIAHLRAQVESRFTYECVVGGVLGRFAEVLAV